MVLHRRTPIRRSRRNTGGEQTKNNSSSSSSSTPIDTDSEIVKSRSKLQSCARLVVKGQRRSDDYGDLDFHSSTIYCDAHLEKEEWSELAKCLIENRNVQSIELDEIEVGIDGCHALNRIVSNCQTKLEELMLWNCPNTIPLGPFRDLAAAISGNGSLKRLSLVWCNLEEGSWASIASVIRQNKNIESLRLGSSNVGPDGCEEICESLTVNNALKELCLPKNVGTRGHVCLARALVDNNTLRSLNLSHNEISDEACEALTVAFSVNTSLTSLRLRCAKIPPRGWQLLVEWLGTTRSLNFIDLHAAKRNNNEWVHFARMLAANESITEVDLSATNISTEELMAIAEALETNSTL